MPSLNAELLQQIFWRMNSARQILEDASSVPKVLVQLIHQDLPLLLQELVRARPDLSLDWNGSQQKGDGYDVRRRNE